jgi:hypothetical protein
MTGSRKGKMQIGGHFDPRDVFTLQEVLARESRERGERKTMQEALDEMVRDYCARRGVSEMANSCRIIPLAPAGSRINGAL